MEFDLHIHTNLYSGCSNINPLDAVKKAAEAGLDGIAFTEHGIQWRDEEIDELKSESGVEGLVLLAGQEVACYSKMGKFQGEFLVFGYPASLGSNKSVEQVITMVHECGGIVIAAHPFKRHDTGHGYYGSGDATADYALDGIEVEHPAYDRDGRTRAALLAAKMGIAGIGCSDAHDLRSIGACRTVFEREVPDIPSLCEELKSRRVTARGISDLDSGR
jgi:hypothetical protein